MKRKEKPLTPEEIKARLIQQNLENWSHSEPQFSLFPTLEGLKILPLSKSAEQDLFLVFLVDLTHYSADQVLSTLERFHHEYKGLPWKPVLVMEQKYLFLKDTRFYDRFRNIKSFNTLPLFLDGKGEWFEHFNAGSGMILLLHRGNEILRLPLLPEISKQIAKMERALQEGLRLDDPGLPLLSVKDQAKGLGPDLRVLPARELTLNGNWMSTPESVVTEDSNAQLSFYFEGSYLRLVASPHPNSREPTRFVITLNQEPIPSVHYGSNTRLGEKGSSISEVSKSHGVFELIHSNTPLRGDVRIKFFNAVENPVII